MNALFSRISPPYRLPAFLAAFLSLVLGVSVLVLGGQRWGGWFGGPAVLEEEEVEEIPPSVREERRAAVLESGGGVFAPEEKVATVGLETLYGCDLNYHLLLTDPVFLDRAEVPAGEDLERLWDEVLTESIILQEAAREGFITLSARAFDTKEKDYPTRNRLYEEARTALVALVEERITVEGIFIYFDNQAVPEMGVGRARVVTREKMDGLHERLVRGELTFEQAASLIRKDESLSAIDPIWGANAYALFADRNRTLPLGGEENRENSALVWGLSEGEVSPVLLGKEAGNPGEEANEAYWVVYRVKSRRQALGIPWPQWLAARKAEYEIEKFL